MKPLRTFLAFGFIALGTALSPAAITNYQVNFNGSATDLSGNFLGASDVAAPGLAWDFAVGVGGGGGLIVNNTGAANVFYRPNTGTGTATDANSTFDFAALTTGQGYRSTADFVWSNKTATDLTVLTMGFAGANTLANATSSANSIAGSIIRNAGTSTVSLRIRFDNTTPTTITFNQSTLTAGSWYRLQYDLVKGSAVNTFDSIVTLYSIGADGTGVPVIFNDGTKNITVSGTQTSGTIAADTTMYSVIDVRNNAALNGISSMDNLGVSFIPEPSSLALLGLGSLGLVSRRRR